MPSRYCPVRDGICYRCFVPDGTTGAAANTISTHIFSLTGKRERTIFTDISAFYPPSLSSSRCLPFRTQRSEERNLFRRVFWLLQHEEWIQGKRMKFLYFRILSNSHAYIRCDAGFLELLQFSMINQRKISSFALKNFMRLPWTLPCFLRLLPKKYYYCTIFWFKY